MPGPLHGIRVIDLTSMISGPLATMTLGDQGADVIKVEAPGGGDVFVRNFRPGLASVRAGSDEERPRLVRTILPDRLTGVVAARAITAALLARAAASAPRPCGCDGPPPRRRRG